MMYKIKFLTSLIVCCCFATILFSCSKEIELDTRNFEKKLVVNSVFIPGKPFLFHFSYTEVPMNRYTAISDSIHVMLYANSQKILDKKILSDSLATSIYPMWGNTYKLKVYVEGYDTIIAYDTIPQLVSISNATLKQPIAIDEYGDYVSQAGITFSDPPNKRNYYELIFLNSQYDYETKITDPVLLNEGDIPYMPTTYFFSDELFNGQKYTLFINRHLGRGIGVKVILRSVSRNYYLYRKYWTRHYFNQPTHESGFEGLIYKGETQTMFTNVENGYGIFVGYVESEPTLLNLIK